MEIHAKFSKGLLLMAKKTAKQIGRPPKYTDEDLETIGKELIEWCKIDGHWHVGKFEVENNLATDFCKKMAIRRKESFGNAYTEAKKILGHKMITQAMTKGGNEWLIRTLTPMYLRDIDEYIENKDEKRIQMQERAKRAAEHQVDQRTDALLGKMEEYIDKVNDGTSVQSETD